MTSGRPSSPGPVSMTRSLHWLERWCMLFAQCRFWFCPVKNCTQIQVPVLLLTELGRLMVT